MKRHGSKNGCVNWICFKCDGSKNGGAILEHLLWVSKVPTNQTHAVRHVTKNARMPVNDPMAMDENFLI